MSLLDAYHIWLIGPNYRTLVYMLGSALSRRRTSSPPNLCSPSPSNVLLQVMLFGLLDVYCIVTQHAHEIVSMTVSVALSALACNRNCRCSYITIWINCTRFSQINWIHENKVDFPSTQIEHQRNKSYEVIVIVNLQQLQYLLVIHHWG
jgi:hypothetical protein